MKIAELRELTNEELHQKLDDMLEEMFNLRFQKAMNRLENAMRIREVRRDVARIKTLMTERERSAAKA
jgi:large subunit ribosomal protein L29